MKKVMVIVTLFGLFILGACSGGAAETKSLDGIEQHFKDVGLEVADEKQDKMFQMIGAKNGFGLDVEGTAIELYEFDKGADQFKVIKEQEAMNGTPVTLNGNLILLMHGENKEVVEAFEEY
ncbi:hypothetical protein GLW08_08205 [Pontibacillus yanchengensis]|uniref:Uncharacterized protein n=1 Tax=Pontibacillus yanchengensis TaxID=462910 RepID=A0ACC7VGT6_9BACI|nr:hypothetical protein [Pontibacillus yanchengensis]MYL53320.1 hypothetical protein [Pontibacillus yanchengensis]